MNIKELIADQEAKLQWFLTAYDVQTDLTGRERQRLFGAGIKNYGFIETAFTVIHDNPRYAPPNMEIGGLKAELVDFADLRQLMSVLTQFLRVVKACLLVISNRHFHAALRIYDSLKEQAKNRVSGARDLLDVLADFYCRGKHRDEGEPTEGKIEKDFKKLEHGKAEGEMVVRSEMPHTSGGERTIVDSVENRHG